MELFDTHITREAKQYVMDVLESGHLSEGEMVVRFEKELEKVFGYTFGVAVNSGTAALHLALILSGVKKGDEVILPAQTFLATGLAVLYCGATPVFSDIGMDGNLSAEFVNKAITKKTKAIICVSWGGNPCDLERIEHLCNIYGIKLIQDNAQALGAYYNELPVTQFGDFSCFSFQAIKQLTTGDGGLLVCKRYNDYRMAQRLRWFGIDRQNDLPDETGERHYNITQKLLGYKYHMSDYSAALGLGNLHRIDERQERRDAIVDYYDTFLLGSPVKHYEGSSNWLYTRLVDNRKEFMTYMRSQDIPVSVVHVGIHRNDIFGHVGRLPNQEVWDESHFCLPCHAGLTDYDVERVVRAYNSAS